MKARRQATIQTDMQSNIETEKEIERKTYGETSKQTSRHTDSMPSSFEDKHSKSQVDIQTDKVIHQTSMPKCFGEGMSAHVLFMVVHAGHEGSMRAMGLHQGSWVALVVHGSPCGHNVVREQTDTCPTIEQYLGNRKSSVQKTGK